MVFSLGRVIAPIALLAVTSAVGVSGSTTHIANVVISGTVRDVATKQPLGDAVVVIDRTTLSARTNAAGQYRLDLPDSIAKRGSLTINVRRTGYVVTSRVVQTRQQAITVDFSMTGVRGAIAAITQDSAVPANEVPLERMRARKEANQVATQSMDFSGRGVAGGVAAGKAMAPMPMESRRRYEANTSDPERPNTEGYDAISENPFIATATTPRSTFSIDVDRASYSNVRRFITSGQLPPRDAVRLEELINYFPYELPAPRGDDPVSITTEVAAAPWNTSHQLLRVGLRGRPIDVAKLPPNNLVFLIDVSGSMSDYNKLPLLKQAFQLLVDELRPQDRVALVVYAGQAGLVLPSTPGNQKEVILEAIERLSSGGSTAGGAGIRLAYDVAKQNHIRNGNNRVILATDGDFNVGVSSDAELVELIEQRREQGTFLTVLGFGTGNVKDSKMEKLADKGNGNYAYVDNITEARKVLVTEMGATLVAVAKDVKLQLEFNPSRVAGYRLLGYENRLLRDEDFKDDTKDAGELGAGHSVTALYELIPPGAADEKNIRRPDSLRYTQTPPKTAASSSSELLFVKLRYKQPTGAVSKELSHIVRDETTKNPSLDFRFASAVAEFGMVLRDSPNKGKSTIDDVIARAGRTLGEDEYGYRAEFVKLATSAKELLARRVAAER
jgi:Ca-activated chloride channel family protein